MKALFFLPSGNLGADPFVHALCFQCFCAEDDLLANSPCLRGK